VLLGNEDSLPPRREVRIRKRKHLEGGGEGFWQVGERVKEGKGVLETAVEADWEQNAGFEGCRGYGRRVLLRN